MTVPQYDLLRQHREIATELHDAFRRVIDSGVYVMHWGDAEVAALEREISRYTGLPHAIGCGSGTDALMLVYQALDLKPDDEVVCPAFTFLATASAVRMVGAKPIFADVDPATYNVTAETLKAAVTAKTRAISVVHLFGQLAEMEDIVEFASERGIRLIEDAAQVIGATRHGKHAGSWGLAATLSFFPTKNLGAIGEAGMILTADDALAEQLRVIRNHGSKNGEIGYNSRLDEIQAALLRAKLPHLEDWNRQRKAIGERYNAAFADTDGVTPQAISQGNDPIYHQYVVRIRNRDAVRARLADRGISSGIFYPVALHKHPMFKHLVPEGFSLPNAEQLTAEVLALPIFPGMTDAEVGEVIDSVRTALRP